MERERSSRGRPFFRVFEIKLERQALVPVTGEFSFRFQNSGERAVDTWNVEREFFIIELKVRDLDWLWGLGRRVEEDFVLRAYREDFEVNEEFCLGNRA